MTVALRHLKRLGSLSESSRTRVAAPSPLSGALLAALLSLLVPGAGQLVLGRRRRGLVLVATTCVVIGIIIGVWQQGPVEFLALLVRPRVLVGLLIADAALLAFRLFAVIDAYRLARTGDPRATPHGQRLAARAILALLLLVTTAPHLAIGYYDLLTYGLITDVFSSGEDEDPRTAAPRRDVKLTLPVVPKGTALPAPAAGAS